MNKALIQVREHTSIATHMVGTSWVKKPSINLFCFMWLNIWHQQHIIFFIFFCVICLFIPFWTFILEMSKVMTFVAFHRSLIECWTSSSTSSSSVITFSTPSAPSFVISCHLQSLLHTAASVKIFFVYSEGALKLINGNCI